MVSLFIWSTSYPILDQRRCMINCWTEWSILAFTIQWPNRYKTTYCILEHQMLYFSIVGLFGDLKKETCQLWVFLLSHKYTLILKCIYGYHSLHHFDFQILCNSDIFMPCFVYLLYVVLNKTTLKLTSLACSHFYHSSCFYEKSAGWFFSSLWCWLGSSPGV